MAKRDVTVSYYIHYDEEELLDKLCSLLSTKPGESVSRREATRQALRHFKEHPTEIEAPSRRPSRRGLSALKRIPISLPIDEMELVEQWAEQHSCSLGLIFRQALINLAEAKGIKWETQKRELPPEWERIEITSEVSSLLAGVNRTVINNRANRGDIEFRESDEIHGVNRTRLFKLSDIVSFFNVPDEEVERFFTLGKDEYVSTRYLEMAPKQKKRILKTPR